MAKARFWYDADRNWIQSWTEEEGVTNYVYSFGRVIYEDYVTVGESASFIYAFGKQIAKVEGIIGSIAEKLYYHHDNLGSVHLMTDASGKIKWEQDYLPFGEDLQKYGNVLANFEHDPGYKFTGQRQVEGIGLYYYGARFYDPELGRFITEDTYYGSLLESQTQNLYLYVTNNPLKYVDPTGHYRVAYIDQSVVDIVMEDGDDIEEIVKFLYDTPYMLEHVMEFNVLKDLKDLHV